MQTTQAKQTIQELADDFYGRFEKKTRDNGTDFWSVADGKETEELTNLIRTAHDDMLPDDFKYRFVVEALIDISNSSEEDGSDAIESIEADIYTGELTAWLASSNSRHDYCDEVLKEYGADILKEPKNGGNGCHGTIGLLMLGQILEKQEVLESVRSSLLSILEAQEEE